MKFILSKSVIFHAMVMLIAFAALGLAFVNPGDAIHVDHDGPVRPASLEMMVPRQENAALDSSQLCGELSLAPNCPAIVEKRQDDHADMWPNEVETVTATSVVWTVEAITSTVTTRVSQPNTSQPASTDSKTSSSSSTARSRSTTLTQTSTSEHLGHSTETTSTQSASTKSSSAKSSSVKSSSTQAPTMATLTYTTTVWVGETTTTVLVTRSATANTTTIQSASQSASSSSGRATVSYGESGAGTIKHTGECTAIFVLGAVVALAVGIGGFWF